MFYISILFIYCKKKKKFPFFIKKILVCHYCLFHSYWTPEGTLPQTLHIFTTEVVEMMMLQEIPNMGKDIQVSLCLNKNNIETLKLIVQDIKHSAATMYSLSGFFKPAWVIFIITMYIIISRFLTIGCTHLSILPLAIWEMNPAL